MPTPGQIRIFNEAIKELEEAERTYQVALQEYRDSANYDSQAVDRALTVRKIAQLAVQTAELRLGFGEE